MTENQQPTNPRPGYYPEIAPGVPRYGQYAPPGYQPPNAGDAENSSQAHDGGAQPQGAPGQYRQNQYGQNPWQQATAYAPAHQTGVDGTIRPAAIKRSAIFIWIAAAMHALLIGLTSAVLLSPQYRSQIIDQLRPMVQDDPQAMAQVQNPTFWSTFVISWIIFGVVTLACYIFVGVKIFAGKSWARVLGTVMAVLSLVMLIGNIWGIIQVGLGVFAMISAWNKGNAAFFAQHSAKQQPRQQAGRNQF